MIRILFIVNMIFYLSFGSSFRFSKDIQSESIGFGYNMDKSKFCNSLVKIKACDEVKNTEECEKVLNNLPECMLIVDKWLHSLNETCNKQINILENCVDNEKNCVTELHALATCESTLERPEWLITEHIEHWNQIYNPRTNKKRH